MFNATLADATELRNIIDTVSQIIDEGLFKVKQDGLELVAADRAMVAVVNFKLSSKAFESFACDADQSMGLNLITLLTILKRAGTGDKVTFSIDKNRLDVKMVSEMGAKRNFSLPLIDVRADDVPSIAQFEFPASALVDASMLKEGINDAGIVADSVLFELGDGLKMFAKGDTSHTELALAKGSVLLNEVQGQAAKSRFPIEYLRKILTASKFAEKTRIFLGNDYPMKMEFIGSNSTLSFVIAPRVAEE